MEVSKAMHKQCALSRFLEGLNLVDYKIPQTKSIMLCYNFCKT